MIDRTLAVLLREAASAPCRAIRREVDAIAKTHERRLRELLLRLAA